MTPPILTSNLITVPVLDTILSSPQTPLNPTYHLQLLTTKLAILTNRPSQPTRRSFAAELEILGTRLEMARVAMVYSAGESGGSAGGGGTERGGRGSIGSSEHGSDNGTETEGGSRKGSAGSVVLTSRRESLVSVISGWVDGGSAIPTASATGTGAGAGMTRKQGAGPGGRGTIPNLTLAETELGIVERECKGLTKRLCREIRTRSDKQRDREVEVDEGGGSYEDQGKDANMEQQQEKQKEEEEEVEKTGEEGPSRSNSGTRNNTIISSDTITGRKTTPATSSTDTITTTKTDSSQTIEPDEPREGSTTPENPQNKDVYGVDGTNTTPTQPPAPTSTFTEQRIKDDTSLHSLTSEHLHALTLEGEGQLKEDPGKGVNSTSTNQPASRPMPRSTSKSSSSIPSDPSHGPGPESSAFGARSSTSSSITKYQNRLQIITDLRIRGLRLMGQVQEMQGRPERRGRWDSLAMKLEMKSEGESSGEAVGDT